MALLMGFDENSLLHSVSHLLLMTQLAAPPKALLNLNIENRTRVLLVRELCLTAMLWSCTPRTLHTDIAPPSCNAHELGDIQSGVRNATGRYK